MTMTGWSLFERYLDGVYIVLMVLLTILMLGGALVGVIVILSLIYTILSEATWWSVLRSIF